MNRRWICNDVWMDILPSFDRPQLGLNLALLSYRFDALVDKHFDGKSELPILSHIQISKDIGSKAKVSEWIDDKLVDFPLPEHPLPNKIRFKYIKILYIDHSVIKFLRSNKHIWDRMGTGIELNVWSSAEGEDVQPIWDVFTHQIWPIFASNIRDFVVSDGHHLDNLRRRISPTILTDLNQLISIISILLYPHGIADHETNASARQELAKWLHVPRKDGQPKRLRYYDPSVPPNLEWLNNFKEVAFLRATTSVSYTIQFNFFSNTMPSGQFELVNERTNEKLTLMKDQNDCDEFKDWLLKRCPIIEETAASIQQNKSDQNLDHFNGFFFCLCGAIGPLSPPPTDQSDEKVFSTPGPSDQRKKEK